MSEQRVAFTSCGGVASVVAGGGAGAGRAIGDVRRLIAGWERRLTRFDPRSELSRVNSARASASRSAHLTASLSAVSVSRSASAALCAAASAAA